jgi:hypothetical protein
MSGVEVSRKLNENQMNMCGSCMNSLVQTFNDLKEQILLLNNEKIKLLMELKKSKDDQKEQKRVMSKTIQALEEKLALLNKDT